MSNQELRVQLKKFIDWKDAHSDVLAAVEGIPVEFRGKQPSGLPYSVWQILEHIRLSQADILDFCVNPDYKEKEWPSGYWPESAAPPSETVWNESLEDFRKDCETLKKLTEDNAIDLFAKIPHGTGQTYLREFLLIQDHNSYHIGQIIVLRRLLGAWK